MVPSDKKSRGMIIVRAEGLQQSNQTIKFLIACDQINNVTGGCMGMCGEISPVRYDI
jgi:hypothetical protein